LIVLLSQLLSNAQEMTPESLIVLMNQLYKLNDARPSLFSTVLTSAVLLEEWLIANNHIALFEPEEHLQLAQTHMSLWRRQGIAADHFHFQRAKDIYRQHFEHNANWSVVEDWVEYSQILMNEGEYQQALDILLNKVLASKNETDRYADYIATALLSSCVCFSLPFFLMIGSLVWIRYAEHTFFAGVACKALKQGERANYYFFESVQSGCPKGFTDIDLMTIISRTLEETDTEDDTIYQTVCVSDLVTQSVFVILSLSLSLLAYRCSHT
jgi:tetratricopeptide (TPR) repeat protein